MRLFIAVDIEELKDFLSSLQKQIPADTAKINLTKTFHLTLKFLGEIPDNQLEKIKDCLKKVRLESFSATISNIGFFPSESYIRVIWAGFKDNKELANLQQQVDNALAGLFQKDSKFHPHLTLARVKFVEDKEKFVKILKNIKVDEKTFEIKNIKLIKSTLKPEGPVYDDLGVFS